MPVIILAGEEEFEISQRAEVLKSQLVQSEWLSFNFQKISTPTLVDIVDAAATVPFGPGNRLVHFEQCDLFSKKRGKSSDSEAKSTSKKAGDKSLEDLDLALKSVAEHTYLLFSLTSNFDSTLKVSKVFSKYCKIEEFAKKKYFQGAENRDLYNWARAEAHKFGAVIEDKAIAYLAESSEANLRQMSSEIRKAAIYLLPEKRITLEVISALSPHYSQVFSLLDHYAFGQKGQLLATLEELLAKQSAIPIIAFIQSTLTKWIQIKTCADNFIAKKRNSIARYEPPVKELAKNIAHDLNANSFILEMDLKRVVRLSLSTIVWKKRQLTNLEFMVKTGQIPEKQALVMFFSN